MLKCPIHDVAPLLPHSGRMVLLEEILHYDAQSLQARTTIRPDCLLLPYGHSRLPSYLALEIMAQGIAAWAGIQALNRGEKVRLGFLLGPRKLSLFQANIALDTPLRIDIALSLQDETGMGIFDAALRDESDQHLILQGKLSVFSPSKPIQELA